MVQIVILDDRQDKAERIESILRTGLDDIEDLEIAIASNEELAKAYLETATLWVIDVYLRGEHGHQISNSFIRDHLLAANTKYCRCSSGSGLNNTEELDGFGKYDARQLRNLMSWEYTQNFLNEVRQQLS